MPLVFHRVRSFCEYEFKLNQLVSRWQVDTIAFTMHYLIFTLPFSYSVAD